jgi:hypothetical protein
MMPTDDRSWATRMSKAFILAFDQSIEFWGRVQLALPPGRK